MPSRRQKTRDEIFRYNNRKKLVYAHEKAANLQRTPSDRQKHDSMGYFYGLSSQNVHLDELCKQLKTVMAFDLTPQQLVIVLHHTARTLKEYDIAKNRLLTLLGDHLSCWEEKAVPKICDFDEKQISSTLWSLSALRVFPSKFLWNEIEDRLDTFTSLAPLNFISILPALVSLGQKPSREFIGKAAEYDPRDFSIHTRSKILWTLAVISAITDDMSFRSIARTYHRHCAGEPPNNAVMKQIADAASWFDFGPSDIPEEKAKISSSQLRLCQVFARAGLLSSREGGWISELGHNVDYAFYAGPQLFLIELDGPHHFNSTYEGHIAGYNGGTFLQSALIQKYAPEAIIIRIRYPEKYELIGNPDSLEAMMLESIQAGPGAYETFGRQDGSIGLKPHLPGRDTGVVSTPARHIKALTRLEA